MDKEGKIHLGQGVKAIGFIIIAIGGAYASLNKRF